MCLGRHWGFCEVFDERFFDTLFARRIGPHFFNLFCAGRWWLEVAMSAFIKLYLLTSIWCGSKEVSATLIACIYLEDQSPHIHHILIKYNSLTFTRKRI